MSSPSLRDLWSVFGRIGLLSFGGPAAQIALMHSELVDRHKWLTEAEYLRALSLCMLLPGPEAMQLATYAGWRLRGLVGGLIAGLLFVLPGAAVIAVLAMGYVWFGRLPLVQAAFLGIKAAVIVVVIQALWRVGRKALVGPAAWTLAGIGFLALFVFGLPFPALIAAAGLFGYFLSTAPAPVTPTHSDASRTALLRTVLVWGGLWATPLVALYASGQTFLLQVGLFFSKLAVVTFGGAYAVLAYMTQTVVQDYAWISTGQMIDALGLAETTPGPLILVTQFVAILAGHTVGGMALGLTAGALALWVTFVPCFLWIFAAGPYLDAIAARPRLSAALQSITAAVVGVIANLSIWFALHVLFARVTPLEPLPLPIPDPSSLNLAALALTGVAALALLRLKWSLPFTLLMMACGAAALGLVGLV